MKLKERISWWVHHPRFEMIYLLGGIPHEHINTLHYRNIVSCIDNLNGKVVKNGYIGDFIVDMD